MMLQALLWFWIGVLAFHVAGLQAAEPSSKDRIAAALQNIASLERPGETGLLLVWDSNRYIQCRRMPDHLLRCEAGGSLMQPSLERVLTPERVARLAVLDWHLDSSFGNYIRTFPTTLATPAVAGALIQALVDGYGANPELLEVETDWVKTEACPPRNGPKQNLAGAINDAASMKAVAIHACAYTPPPRAPTVHSAQDLVDLYGPRVAGEIRRLMVNAGRRLYFIMNTSPAYVQCGSNVDGSELYCEAVSAESMPVIASILTPERLNRLHAAGFIDPGPSQNYSKTYEAAGLDVAVMARELLTILFEAYGYTGQSTLVFRTEKG